MPPRLAEPLPDADAGLDWDDAPCPVCGECDGEPWLEATDPRPLPGRPALRFLVVRCRGCRTAYTNPRPAPDSFARFAPTLPPTTHPLERQLLELPPARVLIVGEPHAELLCRLREMGWVVSVEPELPHPELPPAGFDVVAVWPMLADLSDPQTVLRAVYHLLPPGGKVLATTPNAGGWAARRYAADWVGFDAPRRLTHFTPEAAAVLLQTAGLRPTKTLGLRDPSAWRTSATLAATGPDSDWLDHILKWPAAAALAARLAKLFHHPDTLVLLAERPA